MGCFRWQDLCRRWLFGDRYVPSLAQEQTWARARRLRLKHPEEVEMHVSHETIYQALYVQGRGSLRLEIATALRSGRARRRLQRPDSPKAGRNENTNGLLRQYFPKSTDLPSTGPASWTTWPPKSTPDLASATATAPEQVLTEILSNPSNQTGDALTT